MNRNGEQNFLNYLGLSLWISSKELMPDKITQIVGIEPSHIRVRGALIPGRAVNRRPEFDVHEWQFRKQLDLKPGNCSAQDCEEFINEFLDRIKGSTPQIRELSEHHNVTISFVYHVSELPYIGLTRQQIWAIAALGARLDYDLLVEDHGSDKTEDHNYRVEVE
jgi:hypothetical protein